jgi:outer membrane protein OmpA-like peptidoglycan-associated protein
VTRQRARGALRALPGVLLLAGGLVVACARQPVVLAPAVPPPVRDDLVVVVPGPDGRTGRVTVTQGTATAVLDSAYAAARIREPGRVEIGRATEQEVRAVFGGALDAQPARPVSFTVFFVFGTDELTPESLRLVADISAEIARRAAAEVVVVGHTDRVGSAEQNDALSQQRAERVGRALRQAGVAGERIQVAGRGEREPLVPTGDEVAKPRNRRVEITVR